MLRVTTLLLLRDECSFEINTIKTKKSGWGEKQFTNGTALLMMPLLPRKEREECHFVHLWRCL